MSNTEFSQILEQVCMEEYAVPDKVLVHHFSFRHRKNMRRILDMPFSCPEPVRKLKPDRRTMCILIAAIFLALLTVSGAAYYISIFIMKEHRDNTQLFAFDVSGAPDTIRREYYISALPDGYFEADRMADPISIWTTYQHGDYANNTIILTQTVKKGFDHHFNTEGYSFEEVEINGHEGLFISWACDERYWSEVVWDNGDYILTIDGMLPKKELINLAESTEFYNS